MTTLSARSAATRVSQSRISVVVTAFVAISPEPTASVWDRPGVDPVVGQLRSRNGVGRQIGHGNRVVGDLRGADRAGGDLVRAGGVRAELARTDCARRPAMSGVLTASV